MNRYHELRALLNANSRGFVLDLDCPCDRTIVDECIGKEEAFELLSLHDARQPAFTDDDDTIRVSLR